MLFHRVPADRSPARELIAAMVAEIESLYGGSLDDDPRSPSATPADFSPPGGACLVGLDETGRPVCVGGVKRLEDGVAEIKRMYVLPEARGRGAARALLVALEDAARELGYTLVRLDTGRSQPHARALYESAGYRSIADYNANPYAAWWGEREI
jgi:GNAT superfamily N-acetyltransferase